MSAQPAVRLSLIRNERRRRLSKLFFATPTGIQKESSTHLVRGAIRQFLLPLGGDANQALVAFAQILETMPSDMALTLGVPKNGDEGWQPIASADARQKGAPGILRSGADLGWPAGAGFGFFDRDGGTELLSLLEDIWPPMREVAAIVRPSSSAGVFNPLTGERYAGGGEHLYAMISVGARLRDVLFAFRNLIAVQQPELITFREARLSDEAREHRKQPAIVERGPIDLLVGSPERLIYEGAPLVTPPLAREPTAITFRPGGILDVDALVAFSLEYASPPQVWLVLEARKIACGFAVRDASGRVSGVRETTRGGSIESDEERRHARRAVVISERERLHRLVRQARSDIEIAVQVFLEEATTENRHSRAVTAVGLLILKGWPDREIKDAISHIIDAWRSVDDRDLLDEVIAYARRKHTERRGAWLSNGSIAP